MKKTKTSFLANEIAPRVHNSGHWSIEGAITSQFENHMRAVVGLPLGDTDNVYPSVMVNVLGEYPNIADVLQLMVLIITPITKKSVRIAKLPTLR